MKAPVICNFLVRTCSILLALLLGAALAPRVEAQTYFGDWEDDVNVTVEMYVSTAGNDNFPGLSPSLPKRTITATLAFADQFFPNLRVTINVFPGTYDTAGGETFPLNIPAFGRALETYGPTPGMPPTTRAVIDGGFASETVVINRVGDTSLPETVLTALEIRNGGTTLVIDPARASSEPPDVPVAVEVRYCWIHKVNAGFLGVNIINNADWVAFHVLENNDIGDEDPVIGIGLLIQNFGTSSTLVRSNRIFNWEDNLMVFGNEKLCRPRIFSNFIQLGERNVELFSCQPFVINNTIAWAIDYSVVQVVDGLIYSGNLLTLVNNILWNPQPGSGAMTANDLTINGVVIPPGAVPLPHIVLANDIEDGFVPGNYSMPPRFVGGDLHPGVNTPTDLHLMVISPMIDLGLNGFVANMANPAQPWLIDSVGAFPLRVDVNMDVDTDPRILMTTEAQLLNVDVGGDEVTEALIVAAPNPVNPLQAMDAWGNLRPYSTVGGNSYRAPVDIQGIPGRIYVLQLGFAFWDNYIMQNVLTPWGNVHLDLGLSMLVSNGVIGPNGTAQAFVDFGAPLPTVWLEAETHLQALVYDPVTNVGQMTNRLRIEMNQ